MSSQTTNLPPKQKNIARAVGFVLPFAMLIIVLGVTHGALGKSWITLANVLGYLTLTVIILGVISWIVLRIRGVVQK
jgi:hypothetical protein